jgi:predicted RNA-binding Zn ribbon-like protein
MLVFMTELINTSSDASDSREDELLEVSQLNALLDVHEYTGRRDDDAAELAAVRGIRSELRSFWRLDRDEAAELVNEMLRREHALPQLVRHGSWDWHMHAIDRDAPLADRIRVEAAMAMFDVVRDDELGRLGECAADDCTAVLIDLSRNRSKRYCDVGNCGNRMNVNAYRARRAGGI